MENREITYRLTRESTSQLTGYFAALPVEDLSTEEALALLVLRPMDSFLHQYVLNLVAKEAQKDENRLSELLIPEDHPVYEALKAEYLYFAKGRKYLKKTYSGEKLRTLSQNTPLIYLRSLLEPDQVLHQKWTKLLKKNIHRLEPLPSPDQTGLKPPFSGNLKRDKTVTVSELRANFITDTPPIPIPPEKTSEIAEDRLIKAGVELGQLMRHESSLSPIGLLRTWQFSTQINNQRNRYNLHGEQTSYGRGLSLETAKASLMMEIVERCSAFASFSDSGLENYQNDYPVRHAGFSELSASVKDGEHVLNPSDIALEVSYKDQPLHWVCGEMTEQAGISVPAWIPIQTLFLFCNPDEPALFSGLGSTGFASGNTIAQAKVSALLEIIERHQSSTVPYSLDACFQLAASDKQVSGLLGAYKNAGINLWFQDITPENGIPCCRCIAVETGGEVHIGTAAHLNARRAIISAITETTCPFPNAPETKKVPSDLTLVGYENLPDYSTGDFEKDLALLESLFIQNRYNPCYIDLTRADIGLPVVRAIVAGMEVLGDFDAYSRVHPELYQNYLKLF